MTETGKIADPTAKGVNSEVDGCIANQMKSWRFVVQKDRTGKPIDGDFSLSLALVQGN